MLIDKTESSNIIIFMTDKLYKMLCRIIPICYVSVSNTEIATVYSFEYTDPDGEVMYVDLFSQYSHNSPNGLYAKYGMFIDSVPVCFTLNKISGVKSKNTNTTAEKMEKLLNMCSKKIVAQELAGQKMNMVKTLINEYNINNNIRN